MKKGIPSITNPNNPSQLHMDLSKAFATQEEADKHFVYTQTQEFKDKFGDWQSDYDKDNRVNQNVYGLTGEPQLFQDSLGQYHFRAKDGSKIRLERKVLDFDYVVREALVGMAMTQLFGNNIQADLDILDNVSVNSIFTDKSEGSIYNIFEGNEVNLRDIRTLVKERLRQMGIKILNDKEDHFDPEDNIDFDEITNTREIDLRPSFEKPSKDNASANIKYMFSFVPEMEVVGNKYKQKQHKVILSDGGEFVYNGYYKFDKIWNIFEETLAGMTYLYNNGTIVPMLYRMVTKMSDEYFDDPTIIYLLNEIQKLPEYKKTEFVHAFLKDKMSYVTSAMTKKGSGITFRSFDSASVTAPHKKIINSWNAGLGKSKVIKSTLENKFIYNIDYVNKLNDKFQNDVIPALSKPNAPYTENLERVNNFLKAIGIELDIEVLNSYVQSYAKETSVNTNLILVADDLKYIFKGLTTLKNNDILDNRNESLRNVYNNKAVAGQINKLAQYAAKFRRDLSENTVMGAEGKKNWLFSQPSYIKNRVLRLKQDAQSELPFTAGYYKNSIVLNKLRNPEANKEFIEEFDISTFLNFKEEQVADEGTDNKGIEQADQATDMINKVLIGVLPKEKSTYYSLSPADKGTMHQIKGLGLIQNVLDENDKIKRNVTNIFSGYLLDELHRIQEEFKLINNEELIKSNPEKFIKDYHFKLVDNKPVFFDKEGKPVGNAFKITLFPELSPFADRSKLSQDLKDVLEDIFDTTNGILKREDAYINSNDKIINFINNELLLQTAIDKQNLKNIKVIRNERGVETFPVLDTRVLNTYKQVTNGNTAKAINRAVADFTINQMIANIEYTKVFTGDPAYFKDLADFSKRIPGTYTDGTQLALREGDNPEFTVATLPQIIKPSKTLNEISKYSKKLAKLYSKVNATDGQGYITLDRWYFIMSRCNHWNPKFEATYQRMLDGTTTEEDYKYAAQLVKGVHYEVVNGVPRYIKYSAAVLIPHVIKGTDLQKLNDDMIAQGVDEAIVVDGLKVGSIIPSDVIDANSNYIGGKLNSIKLRNNNYKIQQDLRPKGVKQTLLGSQIKKTILTNIKLDQMYGDMSGQDLVNEVNEILSAKSNKGLKRLGEKIGIDENGVIRNKEKLYSEIIKSLSERGANENLITALSKEYDLDVVANYRQKIQNTIQSIISGETIKVKTLGASYIQMSSWSFDSIEDAKNSGVKLLVDEFTGLKAPHVYIEEGFNESNKTQQNNIVIKSIYQQAGIDYAESIDGIFSLRVDSKPDEHFGNPFTGSGKIGKGVIKAFDSIPEAVQAYKDWLTTDKYDEQFPELLKRKKWIFNQIQSGKLKNKPIVYYKELNELSHANILDELINGNKRVTPGQIFVSSNYISKFIPNWKTLPIEELKAKLDPRLLNIIGYRVPNQGMSSNDSLEIVGILPESYGDTIVPYVDITTKTGSDFDIDKMYVMIPASEMVGDKLTYIEYDNTKPAIEQSDASIDNRLIELMQIILQDEKTYEQLMSPLDSEFLKNDINNLHGNEDNKNIGARFFTPTYQLQKKFDNSGGKSGVGLTSNQLVDHMWTQTSGMKYCGNLGFGHIDNNNNTLFSEEFDILGEHRISDVLSWFRTAYVNIAKDPYVTKGNHNQYTSNTVFMLIRSGAPISFVNRLVGQPIVKELAYISSLRKSRVKEPDYRKLMDAAKEDLMLASGLTKEDIAGLKWQTAENYIDRFNNVENKSEAISRLNNAMEKDLKATQFIENDVVTPLDNMSLEEKKKWFGRQMSYLDLWDKFHNIGESFAQTVLASKQDVNGGGKDFVSAYINKNRVKEASELGFIGFNSRFKDTFLGTAYENSTELSINIMSQLFVTANESAQDLYNGVNKLINPKSDLIFNENLAFELEKGYFSNILGQTGFNLPTDIVKGLFMGSNTVYDRVLTARNGILKDNYFLSLLDVTMEDGIKFVKMDSTRNNSAEALNEISRSWKELLESENSFAEQLGKDLIYYSFYNSGFRTNISSYFEHIPSDYLANMLEEGIEDAKRNYSGGIVGLNNFVDKFFRNNWNNDEIVPIVQMKPTQLRSNTDNKITINTLDSFASTGTESDKYLKPYVKERKFNQDDTVTINLFKQVAVEVNKNNKPIKSFYVRVPKLGYSKAGNYLVEYNSSIHIDGDSIINSNNLPANVKEYMQIVQEIIDYNICNGEFFSVKITMDLRII